MPRSREAGEKGVLPPFTLVQSYELQMDDEDEVMLELQCPRCQGVFIVELERFTAPLLSVIKKELEIKGRTCPYCMRVSEVPAEYVPERWHASDAPLAPVKKPVKKVRIKRTKR